MIGSGAVHLQHSSLQAASASLRTAGSHLQHVPCVSSPVYPPDTCTRLMAICVHATCPNMTGPSSQLAPWHHSLRQCKAGNERGRTLLHATTPRAAAHALHDAWHRQGCQLSMLAAFLGLSSDPACQHPPAEGLPTWRRSDPSRQTLKTYPCTFTLCKTQGTSTTAGQACSSMRTCASAVSARFSGLLREASGSCFSSRSASTGLLSAK